jgi:hypothetical protein
LKFESVKFEIWNGSLLSLLVIMALCHVADLDSILRQDDSLFFMASTIF